MLSEMTKPGVTGVQLEQKAKEMVEAFFTLILDALESGKYVKLSGFGNFQLRDKLARPGRNLKTGEVMSIAARRVVVFHASRKLKARIEDGRRTARFSLEYRAEDSVK